MSGQHDPGAAYDGPASIALGEVSTTTEVTLRGAFQPIDGRFHWFGRLAADTALEQLTLGSTVTLRTPHGSAEARVSDPDPWGRLRVTGTGRPPF